MYANIYAEDEYERREREAQARLAKKLCDSAEHWQDKLRSSTPLSVVVFGLAAVAFSASSASMLTLLLMAAWGSTQWANGFQPSCCRTTGLVAVSLSVLAVLVQPGPGRLATPFFELPVCLNSSAPHIYGLHHTAGATDGGACAAGAAPPLIVPLPGGSLDAARAYRPVVLMPSKSHAALLISIEDADGRSLYPPTKLDLGPDDRLFPWGLATSASALAGAATAVAATTPVASSFAASTRRRRLRGFRMGGGGFGGGGFTRGTGSFFSPNRGVSQGPSAFGRGPTR